MTEVTTFFLEMNSMDELKAKARPDNIEVVESQIPEFRFNRYLYQLVGEQWQWTDKLAWSDEQWREYAERGDLRTWVARSKGSIAGYYELQKQDNHDVELAYFGLAPKFIGMGLGGYFLSHAIESAWSWEPIKRLTVNTCTLDHHSALQNYQARGFKIFKTSKS